jgi:hypothetical protein
MIFYYLRLRFIRKLALFTRLWLRFCGYSNERIIRLVCRAFTDDSILLNILYDSHLGVAFLE